MSERQPAGVCTQCAVCSTYVQSFHLVGSLRRSSTMIKWSEKIKKNMQPPNDTLVHSKQTKLKRADHKLASATGLTAPTGGM